MSSPVEPTPEAVPPSQPEQEQPEAASVEQAAAAPAAEQPQPKAPTHYYVNFIAEIDGPIEINGMDWTRKDGWEMAADAAEPYKSDDRFWVVPMPPKAG